MQINMVTLAKPDYVKWFRVIWVMFFCWRFSALRTWLTKKSFISYGIRRSPTRFRLFLMFFSPSPSPTRHNFFPSFSFSPCSIHRLGMVSFPVLSAIRCVARLTSCNVHLSPMRHTRGKSGNVFNLFAVWTKFVSFCGTMFPRHFVLLPESVLLASYLSFPLNTRRFYSQNIPLF